MALVTAGLVAARYVTAALFALSLRHGGVAKLHMAQGRPGELDNAAVSVGALLSFGGWMTVSNIVSPAMAYLDRFIVSSISGVHQVAYYTTPYDLMTRVAVIPDAVFGVIFPRMSAEVGRGLGDADRLYLATLRRLGMFMAIVCLIFIASGEPFLALWLSEDFGKKSGQVLSVLVAGLFLNTMARPAYNHIQAHGRADVTAKLHLGEVVFYIPLLYIGISHLGIMGAALIWVARVWIDFLALSALSGSGLVSRRPVGAEMMAVSGVALAMLAICSIDSSQIRMIVALSAAAIAAFIAFRFVASGAERLLIARMVSFGRM